MAEINIERKQRSLLPWLLAGILVLALLWFLFTRNSNGGGVAGVPADSLSRDSAAAAGVLAPPSDSFRDSLNRDSMMRDSMMRDTTIRIDTVVPPSTRAPQ